MDILLAYFPKTKVGLYILINVSTKFRNKKIFGMLYRHIQAHFEHWVPSVLSGGKVRPWRDADHTTRSSAEVNNEELYILYPLVPVWRVRDIFTF
jgi:hypothetical protein